MSDPWPEQAVRVPVEEGRRPDGPAIATWPVGLPPGTPPVRPTRPRLWVVLGWVFVVLLVLGCGLLTLLAVVVDTGVVGFVAGTVLAAVPVAPVVATFLWLDRYEAEPRVLLVLAFAWGAAVATFAALVLNTASQAAIVRSGGDPSMTAVVVAPVTEEVFKGLGIVVVLLLRRREFDGVVDGIVYAGLVGIGFAFVENILYLGRTLGDTGTAGALVVFVLRCVVSPFAHPLFTMATGVGIGLAVSRRSPAVRLLGPLVGLAVAVTLHGLWNLSAVGGLQDFVAAYVLLQLPIFLGAVLLAVLARRRERRLIARHLDVYGRTGWLTDAEVGMLQSLPQRQVARGWALRTGGPAASAAMRDFQELATELAFLRERMVRGTAPDDARHLELALLATMSQVRTRFVPRWA